ncbi:MAG: hypothetical protein AB8B94_20695 [Hyphomicrobiales bacterium]
MKQTGSLTPFERLRCCNRWQNESESKADRFLGLQGFDTIDRGAGADVIFGGLDDDVLTGGAGGDTFVFQRRADGNVLPEN